MTTALSGKEYSWGEWKRYYRMAGLNYSFTLEYNILLKATFLELELFLHSCCQEDFYIDNNDAVNKFKSDWTI